MMNTMLELARRCLAGHQDASQRVRNASRFAVNLPVLGKVSIPPPDHLAFYGVLGLLSITELIPWPVAIGLGVGHAVTVRHAQEPAVADGRETAKALMSSKPAATKRAPAKKADGASPKPAKKATGGSASVRKAPAKKAARRSTAASAR